MIAGGFPCAHVSCTGCCTTAYTGLVALPASNELVITYDMIARECTKSVCQSNPTVHPCGCDLIVSMKLMVSPDYVRQRRLLE